jgi:bacterioferritin-associated ferredoxin
MTAGAAQILLKASGMVAEEPVFIGCGPLLYLVAYQYLQAGVRIRAILDTTDRESRFAAVRHLPGALRRPSYLAKGIRLLSAIRRAHVPVHRDIETIELLGEDRLRAVHWRDAAGEHSIECEHAFLHQGIIPNVNMTMAAGCRHHWHDAQLCWAPVCDPFGRTSLNWLLVAGDGGGIGGAKSAALSGAIAGHAVAHDLGRIDRASFERICEPLLATRRRDLAVRPFLERLYTPAKRFRIPADGEVIVCRCEEVRRRDIDNAVSEGCSGPNQLKSFTRAGMGPCQGRLCGHTIVETMAELSGRSPMEVGYYRVRMPIKPVTVGEIAGNTATSE